MKKRIFYVINLDKERIMILFFLGSSLLATSFAIGYRMGRNQNQLSSLVSQQSISSNPLSEENKEDMLTNNTINNERELTKPQIIENSVKLVRENTKQKDKISVKDLKNAEKINIDDANIESTNNSELSQKREMEYYKEPFQNLKKSEKKETANLQKKVKPKYYIQIISLKRESDAKKILNQLSSKNLNVSLKKNKNLYSLYLEGISEEDLESYKEKLYKLNFKNIQIKRIN